MMEEIQKFNHCLRAASDPPLGELGAVRPSFIRSAYLANVSGVPGNLFDASMRIGAVHAHDVLFQLHHSD